jgi:hypothetical protein
MVRERGRWAELEARRCGSRGKTQQFAAKEFPAAWVQDYSLQQERAPRASRRLTSIASGERSLWGKRITSGIAPSRGDVGSLDGLAGKLGTGSCTASAEVQM